MPRRRSTWSGCTGCRGRPAPELPPSAQATPEQPLDFFLPDDLVAAEEPVAERGSDLCAAVLAALEAAGLACWSVALAPAAGQEDGTECRRFLPLA